MGRVRTILAATDFSAPARHATARAIGIAHEVGAAVALIHVLNRGALDELRALLGMQAESVERQLVERARAALAEVAARVGALPDVHVAAGSVVRGVLDHADAIDADLLVLGARGEGFMRHLLLGSTAERFLRKSLRPMLVVKQRSVGSYRRVLVPVDFSPWSRSSLELARTIAPRAELILLHAFDVPFEGKLRYAGVEEDSIHQYRIAARESALREMERLAAAVDLDPGAMRSCVLHGDASRQVIEQEQEQDCDLIVIGKHGRSALEELLLGSVTEHVLAESTCDVLVSQSTG